MPAKILRFPRRHARAPSSKALRGTRPSEARMIGSRHLWGTPRPFSRHFSTALGFTPKDAAISSINFQSNVVFMVPYNSDKWSESQPQLGGRDNPLKCLQLGMKDDPVHIDNEEAAIRARAKEAMKAYRLSRRWSMREMATYLGVAANNYEKYEGDLGRGVPASVIARFCRYTDNDLDWIMLGKKPQRKAV